MFFDSINVFLKSIGKEEDSFTGIDLTKKQIVKKLTLIANKIISSKKEIDEANQFCLLIKKTMENDEAKSISREWAHQLYHSVTTQAKRAAQSALTTIEELEYLQAILLELPLPDVLLSELEAINGELCKLAEKNSSCDLFATLADLKAVHNQKDKLKKAKTVIQEALRIWEQSRRIHTIDIDGDAEIYREYGYKHGRLIEQADFLQQAKVPLVEVPIPRGISNSQLHQLLAVQCPNLVGQWKSLNEGYIAFPHSKSLYLQQPDVKAVLKEIENSILTVNFEHLFDGMEAWLQELKKKGCYLMVRSSGAEDTCQTSNAGGNLSVAYVEPEKTAIGSSLARVVASYYGENSLQNRINSEQNPFAEPQHLAVSLQELIGEQVSCKDPSEIPISLVLFSNEPAYVGKEPFRIMRISATFGHGEGVVGAAGVCCDTFTLLRSSKHPERLYILEDIAIKPKRLAPVRACGEIKLQKVDNPTDIAHKASLDKRLLTQLYYLGVTVEKVYNHPMDMELVIKNGKIYPVQARPINRPEANPTFLDFKKVKGDGERFQAETFLPGMAQAQVLRKVEELLICDTLENAEKIFNKGQHRLIVIRQEEPVNSHPVVNFCGMGIPVLYSQEQEKLQDLANKIDGEAVLICCVQTGQFLLCRGGENFLSEGYTIHPARMMLSVDHQLYTSPGKSGEIPHEIKNLLLQIRALDSQETALIVLKQLSLQLKAAVKTRKKHLVKNFGFERGEKLLQGINSWEKATQTALSIFKKVIKLSPEGRLEPLFHAKVLESLISQPSLPHALGRLSLLNIDIELKNIGKIAAYRSKFDDPAKVQFSEEILIGQMAMTKEQEKEWEQFLIALEDAFQQGIITIDEVMQYRQMLQQLSEFSLLPIWFARFFLPTIAKELPANLVMKQLLEEFPDNTNFLNTLRAYDEDVVELKKNLELFASLDKFENAWKQLQNICKPFVSAWKQQLDSVTPLERIIAIHLMEKLVDLYDSAIKSMKGSALYNDDEKVVLFRKMVEGYFFLQVDWLTHLSGSLLTYNQFWPLEGYLKKMDEILKNIDNSKEALQPSRFNVSAAVIGHETFFGRSLPTTMEDFFTLTHQNLLASIQVLLGKEMLHKTALPDSMEKIAVLISDILIHEYEERVQLTGYTFNVDQIILHYNYPLRNHSAHFSLIFDKESQCCTLDVAFLGESRSRWDNISAIMQMYDNAGAIKLETIPKVKPMGLTYALSMMQPEWAKKSLSLLKSAARDSMGDSYSELQVMVATDDILKKINKGVSHEVLYQYFKGYHPNDLENLSLELKNDKHFLASSVPFAYWPFELTNEFKKNRQLFTAALKRDGMLLQLGDESLKDDENVLIAVRENGAALLHASKEQRDNERIVIVAVTQKYKGWVLSLASERLRSKKETVFSAVTSQGTALQYASEEWPDDLEVVLAAVKQDGRALQFASPRLRDNEEVVLAAVRQNGLALQFASSKQQNNEKIVLAAIENFTDAFKFAHPDQKNNEKVVLAAVTGSFEGEVLEFAHPDQQNNEKIVLLAIEKNPRSLRFAHPNLLQNKKLVLFAVSKDGWALQYAHEKLKIDEEVVLAAVKENGRAIKFAHESLRKNEKVALIAIADTPWALEEVHPDLQDNETVVRAAVKRHAEVIKFASPRVRSILYDEDFCMIRTWPSYPN